MKKEKNKSRFNIFNFMNRDGKGVSKEDITGPPNLKNFFKSLKRKFGKLLSLNLIMWGRLPMYAFVVCLISYVLFGLGGIFEVIFATVASLLGNPIRVASSPLFATVAGAYIASGTAVDGSIISGSASAATRMAVFGATVDIPSYSVLFFVVVGMVLLFSLVTWGWQNVGATYVARGLVRRDPVFTVSDYFHAIKKNLKQGFFLGLIDGIIIILLAYDFCYLFINARSIMTDIMLFISGALIVLYTIMRKYIYMLAITFDMKILKIYKNALIFTVLGIKRNLVGTLGSLILLIVNIVIGILCMNFSFIIILMLPLVYYLGTSLFISAYSAYPVIDKYMIEPYKKSHPDEFTPEDNSDETNGDNENVDLKTDDSKAES